MVTSTPSAIDSAVADQAYRTAWANWFVDSHDPTGLQSESNVLRYRHLDGVLIRVGADTPDGAVAAACRAATICGTRVVVSDATTETDAALGERLGTLEIERIRLLTTASEQLRAAASDHGIEIDGEPVSVSGRRELRRWLREQAISRTTHRHGRVAP
jgi:RHH-type proline utilization regulon transcriptional repressor/proline dehydrogenase/delta 1-pyrroline-5-carboxylate dehydrogenase